MLKRYRWDFVRPALRAKDTKEFLEACAAPVLVLAIPFSVLELKPGKLNVVLLRVSFCLRSWISYRSWATIGVNGRWPAPLWGSEIFPLAIDLLLPGCAHCGTASTTRVPHLRGPVQGGTCRTCRDFPGGALVAMLYLHCQVTPRI